MGGQTESHVEMYVLRRTQKDSQNHRRLGYAFIELKQAQTLRFSWGEKKSIITVIIMKTDTVGWKD